MTKQTELLTQKEIEEFLELFDKGTLCLALELPAPVHSDYSAIANKAAAIIRQLQEQLTIARELLDTRAGKLLQKGIPFLAVKASEPYARQVVELIKKHEGDAWTELDDKWAEQALSAIKGEED